MIPVTIDASSCSWTEYASRSRSDVDLRHAAIIKATCNLVIKSFADYKIFGIHSHVSVYLCLEAYNAAPLRQSHSYATRPDSKPGFRYGTACASRLVIVRLLEPWPLSIVLLMLSLRQTLDLKPFHLLLLPTAQEIYAAAIGISGLDYTARIDAQIPRIGVMFPTAFWNYTCSVARKFWTLCAALRYTVPTPCHEIFRFRGMTSHSTLGKYFVGTFPRHYTSSNCLWLPGTSLYAFTVAVMKYGPQPKPHRRYRVLAVSQCCMGTAASSITGLSFFLFDPIAGVNEKACLSCHNSCRHCWPSSSRNRTASPFVSRIICLAQLCVRHVVGSARLTMRPRNATDSAMLPWPRTLCATFHAVLLS